MNNKTTDFSVNRDGSALDYCRLNDITIQAWSPLQAIIGTMNPEHIKDASKAADVKLSHHDWYELYLAAGKFLP